MSPTVPSTRGRFTRNTIGLNFVFCESTLPHLEAPPPQLALRSVVRPDGVSRWTWGPSLGLVSAATPRSQKGPSDTSPAPPRPRVNIERNR
jgi:hypothetical protein